MKDFKRKIKEKLKLKLFAESCGVSPADLSHFFKGDKNRASRESKRAIKRGLIALGLMPQPEPKKKCVCMSCGKVHIKKIR